MVPGLWGGDEGTPGYVIVSLRATDPDYHFTTGSFL